MTPNPPISIPYSMESERAVLGSILLNQESAFPDVIEVMGTNADKMFFSQAHRDIYTSMVALFNDDMPCDLVTLISELTRRRKIKPVGGVTYLAGLTDDVPTSANAKHYAKVLKDLGNLRNIIEVCKSVHKQAIAQGDPQEIIARIEQEIFQLSADGRRDGLVHISDFMSETRERFNVQMTSRGMVGIPTGFQRLDKAMGGFVNQDLIIIGARPSIGKTALATNIARNLILQDIPVAFFSLEMGRHQILERIIASVGRISKHQMHTAAYKADIDAKLESTCTKLMKAPLYVDDKSGQNPLEIRASLRRHVQRHGVKCCIIDYIQLMRPVYRCDNRNQDIAQITGLLKETAKDLNIPMVVLSQLSRDGGKEDPKIYHLKESGSIEQDADVVLLLSESKEVKGHIKVNIAKQRNGPCDVFELAMDKELQLITDVNTWTGQGYGQPKSKEPEPPEQEEEDLFYYGEG